ncbi:MAG: RnfABCDGE type electron transport complex subunit D [gamma proteobacterium symbiont of Taylorina sp.]|nr:RnfABCDGE type electron transport complex subunit D [gamma proteobacterium symbiont of Taylorina sp.]
MSNNNPNNASGKDPHLLLQSAPLLHQKLTTPAAMKDVWIALLPASCASFWFFGISAVLILLTSIAGAILTEWIFTPTEKRRFALSDTSAGLTGLLLGLTLPAGIPLWMAFLGGMVSIGLGKVIWGGLGSNIFNPALLGRAFLLGTFPIAMTTWVSAGDLSDFFQLHSSNLALPFMQGQLDAMSEATPLGLMKFEQQVTSFGSLFIGNTAGSIGETSGFLIILGGIYLFLRNAINWRIPVAILTTAALFSLILLLVDNQQYPSPLFTLFSGGLLLGTFFMATDPVTSPLTPKGCWIFGIGIGFLVVLIRVYGGLPEGVLYAILLMNAATPLIDRYTQPRIFGRDKQNLKNNNKADK